MATRSRPLAEAVNRAPATVPRLSLSESTCAAVERSKRAARDGYLRFPDLGCHPGPHALWAERSRRLPQESTRHRPAARVIVHPISQASRLLWRVRPPAPQVESYPKGIGSDRTWTRLVELRGAPVALSKGEELRGKRENECAITHFRRPRPLNCAVNCAGRTSRPPQVGGMAQRVEEKSVSSNARKGCAWYIFRASEPQMYHNLRHGRAT